MASLVKKIKDGRPYWYVVESARVNGKPRIVNQKYLGTVESILAAFESSFEPMTVEEVEFGLTAVMWGLAQRVGIGVAVDNLCPKRHQGLSVGAYLQAAAVNRAVSPRSKRGFYTWYQRSVLTRLMPATEQSLTSQSFWEAMDRVDEQVIEPIEAAVVASAVEQFEIDLEALVFDATNFHTFISSTNPRAEVAQRGHAKNKRHDLRLVGLALACSADYQIPLASKLVAGNSPDTKTFAACVPELIKRLQALGAELGKVTLVFDKGNDSAANIASLDDAGIGFVGSLTPTQHADLLAVPDEQFAAVDGLAGVVAYRAQKEVCGALRTVVVTRSESFLEKQLVGLAQTCRRTQTHLSELARLVAGKRHRMDRAKLEQRVQEALAPRWMDKLYSYQIEGKDKSDLTLAWEYDDQVFEALKTRELGKRILFTDRHRWSTEQIVVAYRSQWEVEAAFHQMDPAHGAFRPIYHWTDQKIKVHSLYSVAALLLINLAWREANQAGIKLTPRELTEALSAIREVTLVYPPAKGKGPPRVLKKLTRMDQIQQELFELFQLDAFRPPVGNTAKWRGF